MNVRSTRTYNYAQVLGAKHSFTVKSHLQLSASAYTTRAQRLCNRPFKRNSGFLRVWAVQKALAGILSCANDILRFETWTAQTRTTASAIDLFDTERGWISKRSRIYTWDPRSRVGVAITSVRGAKKRDGVLKPRRDATPRQ